ncbi:MAG: class II aldolase/adducin family protein [Xanthomonadales bacterium]
MNPEPREALVATARAMNDSGLNRGTSGNLSLRDGHGMLITPSGLPYDGLEPEDVVHVDARGVVRGGGRPSTEWRFHHDIYRARPDVGAILHAHPVHCTALACLNRPIPAFHYMVAVAGGRDIRCAPYATFGTQALSDHVLQALDGRQACLMANHGLLCCASTLPRALDRALEIESLAKTYLACLAAGEPVILDDEEMDRVLRKFADYGPRAED